MIKTSVWATVSSIIGAIVAAITLTKFLLEPLERRMDVARENLRQALIDRDARLDYLQRQIDELERGAARRTD